MARRDDATGAVVFEAAADEPHTVGEQRGGDGVAVESAYPPTVETELRRTRGVGEQTGGDATRPAHRSTIPWGGVSVSVAVPTAWMVWVTV